MLTVKKLADLLGLSPEVIRHYTHIGILKPVVNSGNNYKYYDEQDLLYSLISVSIEVWDCLCRRRRIFNLAP